MNEPDIAYHECANGCLEKGTDKPMLATRGNFCTREFGRARAALRIAPELVEHMVSLKASNAQAGERVDSSREAPAPGNEQALNDTHETYRRLVYWSALWSNRMHISAPGPAIGAWRDHQGRIVGLPEHTSPSGAKLMVQMMTRWLDTHLEAIFYLDVDDVNYFLADMADVFRLNARWPRESIQPRFSDMPCPRQDCGGRLAVWPPLNYLDDLRIVCESCGTWYPPDEYEHLILVFKDVKTDERRATKVRDHLARKWA